MTQQRAIDPWLTDWIAAEVSLYSPPTDMYPQAMERVRTSRQRMGWLALAHGFVSRQRVGGASLGSVLTLAAGAAIASAVVLAVIVFAFRATVERPGVTPLIPIA